MRLIILIILTFQTFLVTSQIKKEIERVFLGSYINDKYEIKEVLLNPRITLFNSNNQYISSILYDDSITGRPLQEFKYYYNSDSLLYLSTYGNGVNKPSSKTNYTYNSKQLLTSETSWDIDSNSQTKTSHKEYFYDNNDSIIKQIIYLDEIKYHTTTYKYTYGVYPPMSTPFLTIEKKEFTHKYLASHTKDLYINSKKMLSQNMEKGWITEYDYYSDGRLKTEKRDINGKIDIQYSYYKFDSKGNLKTYAWVDKDGYGEIRTYNYE